MRGKAAERAPVPPEETIAETTGPEQKDAPGDNNVSGEAAEAAAAEAEPELDLRHVEISPELLLEANAIADELAHDLRSLITMHFEAAWTAMSADQQGPVLEAINFVSRKWAHESARVIVSEFTAPVPMEAPTLKGDARDAILNMVKGLTRPWNQMSESDQNTLIRDATRAGDKLLGQAARIAAARGFANIVVSISKFTTDAKGIQATVAVPRSAENLVALGDIIETPVLLIAVDAKEYAGARGTPEADVVGELRMPKMNGVDRPTSSQSAAGPVDAEGKPIAANPTTGEVTETERQAAVGQTLPGEVGPILPAEHGTEPPTQEAGDGQAAQA